MSAAEQHRQLNPSDTTPATGNAGNAGDARYETQDSERQSVPAGSAPTSPASTSNANVDTTLKRSQSLTATSKSKPVDHDKDYSNRLRGKISTVLKGSTGPSFEERAAAGASRMKKKANAIEIRQAQMLEEAVARAKARPIESPTRPKHHEPESVESRVARGKVELRKREREYAEDKADLLYRMKTREPLFRVSEVQAAAEEQNQRQAEYKQAMKDDEERRWEMIRGLKEKVMERPMLVDDYRKPVHATPDQVKREMGEETELDRKIQRGMAAKSFSESSWAQTVGDIKQRADNRVPLHKIPYPPKKFPEYKPRPNIKSSMDEALERLIKEPQFQKSDWAKSVEGIRERQDNRPKLHEIVYPSKV